jgi:aminomethyltransferase
MPIPSPFHERIAPLCTSYAWKDWAGSYAVCHFGETHLAEYWAFREATGMIDVSALYKYEVRGKDAARFLSRVMVRGFEKMKPGRVTYTCWCDPKGRVIDDGTVSRLDDEHFRVTAAEPTLRWMERLSRGYDVTLEDVSESMAALALQGPTSRDLLKSCSDADLDNLRFFGTTKAKVDDVEVQLSRTGYTGDLGYEVWCARDDALKLWDALSAAGRSYGLLPAGLDALDMTRIEAGFIMLGVDYFSAPHVTIDARRSTPYELDLGWCVKLDRDPFIGQDALREQAARGPEWKLVGVETDWPELQELYSSYGLPPGLEPAASRETIPLYADGAFVGYATSSLWSPLLKRRISLATVKAPFAEMGTQLQIEHTVLQERRTVSAVVTDKPFFDPERKRKP